MLQLDHVKALTLRNGLKVYISQSHRVPIACFLICYQVGSGLEPQGSSGISHFLEHIAYKGTPSFPPGVMQELIGDVGGLHGALTSLDYTYYYTLLPAAELELAIQIEADRLQHLAFDDNQVELERNVILTERAEATDSPRARLYEHLWSTAFPESPYRNLTIGSVADIHSITASKLEEHYRKYYRADNAVIVIVGDVDSTHATNMLIRHFGSIPSPQLPLYAPPALNAVQTEPRRSVIHAPSNLPYLAIAWRTPEGDHPDRLALDILKVMLSGAPAFKKNEPTIGAANSLLYHLVNRHSMHLMYATCSILDTKQPGLFVLTCAFRGDAQTAESIVLDELARLRSSGIERSMIDRAIRLIEQQLDYAKDFVLAEAANLAKTIVKTGSHTSWTQYLTKLRAVTAEHMNRVVDKYLTPSNMTTVTLLPSTSPAAQLAGAAQETSQTIQHAPAPVEMARYRNKHASKLEFPRLLTAEDLRHTKLSNGLDILTYTNYKSSSITIRMSFEAGAMHDPVGKEGLALLTCRLANICAIMYSVDGTRLDFDCDMETINVTLNCTKEDVQHNMRMLADLFRHPSFSPEAFAQIKAKQAYSRKLHLAELYPERHRLHRSIEGSQASISSIDLQDIYTFCQDHLSPAGAIIVVVGDLDDAMIRETIYSLFADWQGGHGRLLLPHARPVKHARIHHHRATNITDIQCCWTGVDRGHPDFIKLDVLAHLLGKKESTYVGRLYKSLREHYGLSYYQRAYFETTGYQSPWVVQVGATHQHTEKVLDVLHMEFDKLRKQYIPQNEYNSLLTYITGNFHLLFEDSRIIAKYLEQFVRYHLGTDCFEKLASQLSQITPAELRDAACRYLDDSSLVIITAGPAHAAAEQT